MVRITSPWITRIHTGILIMSKLKSFYNKFREKLPINLQILSSKAVFKLLNKPIYDSTNRINLEKGIVVISADFELAWAWRYSKRKVDALEMAKTERENIPIILKKLNELEIPITWATVGHLFLDSCECKNGKPHSDLVRPKYFENEYWKYSVGDWFDIDPCGNYRTHPEFYAPDLVEMILNSTVKHEIACHSFSHIDYSEKNSFPELIESDLRACEEAASRFGIKLESFVFPGNFHGNFDMLKKHGYKVIRYKTNALKEIGFPEKIENGLIAIHDSIAFDQSEEGWGNNYLIWKMKKYIDKAIEKKAICHFWFHPSIKKKSINEYFIPILCYISDKRNKGLLEIKTMNEIKI